MIANVVYENAGEALTLPDANADVYFIDVNNDGQASMEDLAAVSAAVGSGSGSDAGSGNAYQSGGATTHEATYETGSALMMTSMSTSSSGGGGGSAGYSASTCATTPGWRDASGQIAVSSAVSVEGGSLDFNFQVAGSVGCGVQVNYHTVDGSAKGAGSGLGIPDYTPAVTGTLVLPQGTISKSASIATAQDDVVEVTESFTLVVDSITAINGTVLNGLQVVYSPDYYSYPLNMTPTAATGHISNDDSAELTFSVEYFDAAGNTTDNNEGPAGTSKTARVTATLSKPVVGNVSVDYVIQDSPNGGASRSDGDYSAPDGTLAIPGAILDPGTGNWIPGRASFDITIHGDEKVEGNESVWIDFSNLTSSAGAAVDFADLTDVNGNVLRKRDFESFHILNDDAATVTFKKLNESAPEEAGKIKFTLKLDHAVDIPFTVDVISFAGTAQVGTDYQSASSTQVEFAGTAGEEKSFEVVVLDDEIVEANETFTVQVANVVTGMHPLSGYNVTATGTATGTIENTDEAKVSIVDSNWWFPWVLERDTVNSPYRFHVRLSKQVDAPVTVFYATADGTATAGLDYVAKVGSVVIPAYSDGVDDAIEITIIGDTINEWHETFKVKATSDDDGGGGGRIVDSAGVEATGTINDDD